jgi:lysophospholipase L1-like esterase
LSGRGVVNAGISGETTGQGLQRFTAELDRHNPSLVVLLEGGNDILRNQPFAVAKSNLAAMIELTQQRQIPLLLLGVPEKNLFSSSADFYEELADQYDLLFIEDLVSDLLRTSRYKSDQVHLNAQGYRAMAEAIYDYLQDQNLL